MEFGEIIRTRPGDRRGFLHRSSLVTSLGGVGGTARTAGGIFTGFRSLFGGRRGGAGKIRKEGDTRKRDLSFRSPVLPPSIPSTFPSSLSFPDVVPGVISILGFGEPAPQDGAKPSGAKPCPTGTFPDPEGRPFCVSRTSAFGQQQFGGDAVEGRYGPAFVPESELRDVAVCPTGFALGKDDLCYAHLSNKERKYPRGRRPLLTGGDMRAISRARRAGGRLSTAREDLVALGMLKAPTRRRRRKKVC